MNVDPTQARSSTAWDGPEGQRRRALHAALQRLGQTPADLWHDACLLLADGRFATTTHLVGHALREIDGSLLALLDTGDGSNLEENDEKRKQKIERIAESLDLDPAATKLWKGFNFERLAHRRAPQPRVRDEQFDATIEQYTIVLEAIVAGFERRFHQWMKELDLLLGVSSPAAADLKRLTEGVPLSPMTLGYFFERLSHPDWLAPLRKKHFFDHPAPIERDVERGTVRYHFWPQGGYLERIATSRPKDVAAVVAELSSSGNPYVVEAILQIAAALPMEHYNTVHERVIHALTDAESLEWVWEAGVKLIGALVDAEDARALDVARELLRPVPDPNRPAAEGEEPHGLPLPEPRSKVGRHAYDDLALACVNELLGHRPRLAVVKLFCDLLTEAIRLSQHESDLPERDYSSIWRRRLDGSSNRSEEIRDALVTATRDLVLATASDCAGEFGDAISELVSTDLLIFKRIALFAVATVASDWPVLVGRMLLDRSLFEEHEVEREYADVLSAGFSRLDRDLQETLLEWIEVGPDVEQWRANLRAWPGGEPSDEALAELVGRWQLTRLRTIYESLPEPWRDRCDQLIERHGRSDQNYELDAYQSPHGRTSPIGQEQLAAMPSDDLVSFLRTWTPSGDWNEPTYAGLGDALAESVADDPDHFAGALGSLRGFETTYIRAVLDGMTSAIRANRQVPWPSLWPVIQYVVEQSAEDASAAPTFDRDPGPSWAKSSVVELLSAAMGEGDSDLETIPSDDLLTVIERLATGADPRLDEAARNEHSETAAETLVLTSLRARALGLLVDYLCRLKRSADAQFSIRSYPLIDQLIRERLRDEPATAVLSVLGRRFTTLVAIDEEWAASFVDSIFPLDSEGRELFTATWCGYLRHDVYLRPFQLLHERYAAAVDDLHPSTSEPATCEKRLAEHLVKLYWCGDLGPAGEQDALPARLFANAGPALRAHAMEFIGLALANTEGELDPEIARRIQELWEWRRAVVDAADPNGDHHAEVAAFGEWFRAAKLDPAWELENLEWALSVAGARMRTYGPGHRLHELAQADGADLAPILRCYELMITSDERWQLLGWKAQLCEVLTDALASSDESVRSHAREITNLVIARGHLDFRGLIDGT